MTYIGCFWDDQTKAYVRLRMSNIEFGDFMDVITAACNMLECNVDTISVKLVEEGEEI